MQGRRRKLFANLALTAGALVVAFVLAELGVRALQRYGVLADLRKQAVSPLVEYAGKYRMSGNQNLGWELDPNDPRINADGFRDREYAVGKSDGIRIVALGDSVTFGRGVPLENTYAKVLEDLLNREDRDGPPYEVLNLGVGGYNSRKQLELYKTKGRKYQPDLLVIGFVLNDAIPAPRELVAARAARGKQRRTKMRERATLEQLRERWRTDPALSRALAELRESQREERAERQEASAEEPPGGSRLIALVRDRLGHLRQKPEARRYPWLLRAYAEPETWRVVSDSFQEFSRIAAQDGISVLVVILPRLTDFENYEFAAIHERIGREARGQGLRVLDLYERFRGQDARRFRQSERDTVHLNSAGHRAIAQRIHEYLVASGLLSELERRREGAR